MSPSQPGGSVNAGEKPTAASPRTVAGAVDPFAALDGEGTNPPATWIHAGAHHAEAGYLDPALGWVRIRADSTSGAVHAALVPASAEAAQVLGGHIAGLNAYLSEQHGNSPSVTLAAPQNDGTAMTMGRDSGDQPPSQQQERPRGRENTIVMPSLAVIPVRAAPDQGMMSAYPSPAAGKTISVVA